MQDFIYKHRKSLIVVLIILVLILATYFINKNQSPSKQKLLIEKIIPETKDWHFYESHAFGFNFMNPDNLEVKVRGDTMAVGDITVAIDRLSCKDKKPNKELVNPITIYGYPTMINEAENFAYICNKTGTACLDISSNNKNKTTEGYFHAFVSTLNINEGFDRIVCS